MPELRHLRYFVTVAEEQSFTRAAQRLGMEQPPLSMQIRDLEREIDVRLFHRQPRGVSLTDAGRAFYADARALLDALPQAIGRAQSVARGELGQIRIGMINSAPFHPFVPTVIREFGRLYPNVAVSLQENSTPALAASILSGSIDAAFVRPLLQEERGLTIRPLFDEKMVIALPRRHALAHRRTLPLKALAGERFILFSRTIGSGLYDEIVGACQRAQFIPNIVQEVLHVTSIANLVAANLGVSIVPASMQQVHGSDVTYRPISGDAPKARLSLAWRTTETSAAVRNLVELASRLQDKVD